MRSHIRILLPTDKTSASIGLPPSQFVSWGFAMPSASVTGQVTINGKQHSINAYGEVDHPYGEFVPFVSLKFWNAAQCYNEGRNELHCRTAVKSNVSFYVSGFYNIGSILRDVIVLRL